MAQTMAAAILGAGGAPGQPPEAEPAPVADEQEPGGTGETTPAEDSAPSPEAPEGGATEAGAPAEETPPPADKRLRDTQAALHRAKAESKNLAARLQQLLPSGPAPAEPAAASAPRPMFQPPPAIPTRQLPDGTEILDVPNPITIQDLEAAFQHNSDKSLDDRTAFHRAFGGLIHAYHQRFMAQVVPVLQRVFTQGTARELAVSQARVQRGTEVRHQIEGFWKQMAPQLPARAMWSYASEAITHYPGRGPEAITQQALYCLTRALNDFKGASAAYRPDTNANRAQDALLRPGEGGGGRPAVRPGARPGVTTMVDQIRAATRGLRS